MEFLHKISTLSRNWAAAGDEGCPGLGWVLTVDDALHERGGHLSRCLGVHLLHVLATMKFLFPTTHTLLRQLLATAAAGDQTRHQQRNA